MKIFIVLLAAFVGSLTTCCALICNRMVNYEVGGLSSFNKVKPGGNVTVKIWLDTTINKDGLMALGWLNYTHNEHEHWEDEFDLKKGDKVGYYYSLKPSVAPMQEGIHNLTWSVFSSECLVSIPVEVSCSDGVICNGEERLVFVNNKGQSECQSAARALCDDGVECTEDICTESGGFCTFAIKPNMTKAELKKCPSCKGEPCKPKCAPNSCDNGCGGSCVQCQNVGEACVKGKCADVSKTPGTCGSPFDITSDVAGIKFKGSLHYLNDTSLGVNLVTMSCNRLSRSQQVIYKITNTNAQSVGIDARTISQTLLPDKLDTVLQIIEVAPNRDVAATCLANQFETVVACSDDASPPGGLSSRVTWMMKPRFTYLLVVGGYSSVDVGEFKLSLKFTPECTLQCSAKYCGPSNCANATCGDCKQGEADEVCSVDGTTCLPQNCKPKCRFKSCDKATGVCKTVKKKCGSDGCGGSCGVCADDGAVGNIAADPFKKRSLCMLTTGQCKNFPSCYSFLPKCTFKTKRGRVVQGCPKNHWCSSQCHCVHKNARLFDLVIDEPATNPEIVDDFLVEPTSCALVEGCLKFPGKRRIVRFTTDVLNQGVDWTLPNPPENFPIYYSWGACHGHWHFNSFAKFELYDEGKKKIVVEGNKLSYCATDSHKHSRFVNHPQSACLPKHSCAEQGILRGWIDSYGSSLECQFLDITDVPPGKYFIKQCTNMMRIFQEDSFDNNCAWTPLTIPKK